MADGGTYGEGPPVPYEFTTTAGGETVVFPGTLDGIRAALPPGWRREFDREIGAARLTDVPLIAFRWVYPAEAAAEDDAAVARLRAGDFGGVRGDGG